jgi:uncharacterized membrane protein
MGWRGKGRHGGSVLNLKILWQLHFRLFISIAVGAAIALALLGLPWRMATRLLVGWDAAVALYLVLTYRVMANASVARIRERAAIVDEGATALLILTPAAALASLVAVVIELGHAPSLTQITLAISTIVLSWAFMHSIFALHYAHEFYGEGRDDSIGGLIFPGKDDPDYWDFLYYSLVVAMTAQVSDVQITSKTIRRLTTLHGAISFFFNATVLALTVNIVSSRM